MKRKLQTLAAVLLLAASARADVSYVAGEAIIRNGSYANTDIDEVATGFLHCQYSTSAGYARKTYYQFDLTGLNADTNALATLTIGFRNSYKQRVQLWGLKQAYPSFSADITWNSAQANDTASLSMLETGDFTAEKIGADVLIPINSTDPYTFTIDQLGKYVFDNKVTLVLTPLADTLNNASGLRMKTNFAYLTFSQFTGNLPPTISEIADQILSARQTSAAIPVAVGDDSTPADSLSFWVTSANEAVIPSTSIVWGGAGANRTITITAANQSGTAVLTGHLTDAEGMESIREFTVTVLPDPTITKPSNTNILANSSVTLPFSVGSWDIPLGSLIVTGTSGNQNLVQDSGITVTGSGADRTVTVNPVANQSGIAPITLTVGDGVNLTTTAFAVMVLPSEDVVFCDFFDYADGDLIPMSGGFYQQRNVGSNKLRILTQQLYMVSNGESALAPLAGAPYSSGSRKIFYTSCKALWTGSVFPRNSGGPFLHLGDRVATDSEYFVRVRTVTNNVPEGYFRLGIAAGPGTAYVDSSTDLSMNQTYRIVTRYDMDIGKGTLWIDPTSETSPSISAYDVPGTMVGSVGVRLTTGMGTILLDDLEVTMLTGPIIKTIAGPSAGNVQIEFSADPGDSQTDYLVLKAGEIDGVYSNSGADITALGSGNFRATVPMTGAQSFFRVQRQPVTFN